LNVAVFYKEFKLAAVGKKITEWVKSPNAANPSRCAEENLQHAVVRHYDILKNKKPAAHTEF
jgi:hypothetical protein